MIPDFAGFLPSCRRAQVGIPEGPRSALNGARAVDRALPCSRVKHDAIAVGILDQTLVFPDLADKLALAPALARPRPDALRWPG